MMTMLLYLPGDAVAASVMTYKQKDAVRLWTQHTDEVLHILSDTPYKRSL